MSSVRNQPLTTTESAELGRVRGPWLSMAVTVALSALLLAAGGFLLGTVEGDIPWPATPAEEAVYYSGRYLAWGAVALALVGSVAVAVISKVRSMTEGLGWGWGVLTFAASAVVGGVAFFSAFAVAHEHYLFAFS